jgi:hypothetical protein
MRSEWLKARSLRRHLLDRREQRWRERFVNDFCAILDIGMVLGSSHMVIVKVPTALAAILFVSSVSAQAMQFADRPGLISEMVGASAACHVLRSDDCSRRQIAHGGVLLSAQSGPVTATKLSDRPRPISSRIRIAVAEMIFVTRPGRLSAEFSAVARSSGMKFEYGPGLASGWIKAPATRIAIRLGHRPANRVTAWAVGSIKVGNRDDFTSSLTYVGSQSKASHPDQL